MSTVTFDSMAFVDTLIADAGVPEALRLLMPQLQTRLNDTCN